MTAGVKRASCSHLLKMFTPSRPTCPHLLNSVGPTCPARPAPNKLDSARAHHTHTRAKPPTPPTTMCATTHTRRRPHKAPHRTRAARRRHYTTDAPAPTHSSRLTIEAAPPARAASGHPARARLTPIFPPGTTCMSTSSARVWRSSCHQPTTSVSRAASRGAAFGVAGALGQPTLALPDPLLVFGAHHLAASRVAPLVPCLIHAAAEPGGQRGG